MQKTINKKQMNTTLNCILRATLIQTLVLVFIFNQNACSTYAINITSFVNCLSQQSKTHNPTTKATYYTQNDASFSTILQQYIRNLRFNTSTTPKPLAIVTAKHKSHVQATVICAKNHGLELRIRSGGHDYEGLSYVSQNPFVVLDMFNLRTINIDVDSETTWVQSGATLGELYYGLANRSRTLAFPGGVCPTVGVGGHFSGGGYGIMLRKFGLTIDHIIDAEIVDSNGNILRRNSMDEGLFWAIRGGGASSFCVVLAWKIKLVHVPPIVTTFQIDRTLEQNASEILHEWQSFGPRTDPNLFLRTNCKVIGGHLGGYMTVKVSFIGSYLGNASALVELMNKEFPILGLNRNDIKGTSWVFSNLFFYGFSNAPIESLLSRVPLLPLVYEKHKSDFVQNPIPKSGLEAFFKKLIEVENVEVQFNPYGGMMSRIHEDATPFPHRKGHLFKIQYIANWNESSQDVIDRNIRHVRDVYSVLTPYVSKNPREAFLNYRDIDIGTQANKTLDFAWDFFKGNVYRLIQVKSKVDPDNFFRNEQSIPVVIKT